MRFLDIFKPLIAKIFLSKATKTALDYALTGKIWDFKGGIHPAENKTQSLQNPSKKLSLSPYYYVPLVQHNGKSGVLKVGVGDKVLKGDPLTCGDLRNLSVHSPTSGTVVAIDNHISPNSAGIAEKTVVIKADGLDKWREKNPIDDLQAVNNDEIFARIVNAGIAGLGGGVFPTGFKIKALQDCKLLILNGAECEPYITCDDILMQENADEILQGGQILARLTNAQLVLVAIEDNKPKAIKAMKQALLKLADSKFALRVIPTKYPSGASHQLIEILTSMQVPKNKRASELGILMNNVATAFAVKKAVIDDEPLIERMVTLTGNRIAKPNNYWVKLGTPLQDIFNEVGYQTSDCLPLIIGGPMMGFPIITTQTPVTKTVNCILAPDESECTKEMQEQHCIRCGKCADVCPLSLQPQELYWQARAKNHQKATALNLSSCIECGACDFVCPSNIPLVDYFKAQKIEINQIKEKERKASLAKERFEARNRRLEQEKQEREQRIANAATRRREEVKNNDGEDPVKAALARIAAKKEQMTAETNNSDIIKARRAARLAKKQTQEQNTEINVDNPVENLVEKQNLQSNTTDIDPRKAAVAAALARAKAKKMAQKNEELKQDPSQNDNNIDPRKVKS